MQSCVFQFFIQVKNIERAGVVRYLRGTFLTSCHQLFEIGEFLFCLENSVGLFCCCLFLYVFEIGYFVLFTLLLKPSDLEEGKVK